MGLVSFAPINDGDEANDDLFNSRLGAITDELNGNLDQDNLATSAVSTAKLGDSAVTTSKIATGAVTTPKIKPSTINWLAASGANQATSSASLTDIPNFVTTYTTGATPERLFIWVQGMAIHQTAGSGQATLNINGVDMPDYMFYSNDLEKWDRFCKMYIYDAPASTLVTMKGRFFAESGGTVTMHMGSQYRPSIRGFAVGNS